MEYFNPFITTFFTAILPVFECKGAMIVGLALGLSPTLAFTASFLGSCLPAPILLYVIKPVLEWIKTIPIFKKIAEKTENLFKKNAEKISNDAYKKTQNKYIKNKYLINNNLQINTIKNTNSYTNNSSDGGIPMVVKVFALFTFVAIPLPGTGVWMGSICATLLNIPYLKALAAVILGNFVACIIVAVVSFGFFNIF